MCKESSWGWFFKSMSAPPTTHAAWKSVSFPRTLIAQTNQEIVDATHHEEMQRLANGGKHADPFSDFVFFVIFPMFVCFAVIFIGRRLMS